MNTLIKITLALLAGVTLFIIVNPKDEGVDMSGLDFLYRVPGLKVAPAEKIYNNGDILDLSHLK